jgi:hypothetical protein
MRALTSPCNDQVASQPPMTRSSNRGAPQRARSTNSRRRSPLVCVNGALSDRRHPALAADPGFTVVVGIAG